VSAIRDVLVSLHIEHSGGRFRRGLRKSIRKEGKKGFEIRVED